MLLKGDYMNLSKKTIKHIYRLADAVPEYPRACSSCDYYEEGYCTASYGSMSELWCPYEMFTIENYQGNYRFEIETRYEPNFKEWKRAGDPVYRRCRRYYKRFFKKRKKNKKKAAHMKEIMK